MTTITTVKQEDLIASVAAVLHSTSAITIQSTTSSIWRAPTRSNKILRLRT